MYTYTYNGKEYSLVVAEDKIALRTRNASKLNSAVRSAPGKKILEDFKVETDFKESDVSVLKLKNKVKDKVVTRDAARAVLKTEPDLRFAGRVLIDQDSGEAVLYTENLVIKFKPDVTQEICEKTMETFKLTIKRKLTYAANTYFVSSPEGTGLDVFQLAKSILQLPEVEFCNPELIRKKATKVIHVKQWHLQKTQIGTVTIDAHSNVAAAHAVTQGEGITIAVIDDGVDIDHTEFNIMGKVVSGRDVTLGSNNPRPKFNAEKHGTSCAGVACAGGINASGVAPKAKLMPIRHASELGSMEEADAFVWAVEHGADIISCSWGPVDGDWSDPTDATHLSQQPLPNITNEAIKYAIEKGRNGKGCVIFWAAGNGNENIMLDGYSSNPNVIAVAACNDTNKRSVYSDFGEAVWCCFPSDDFELDIPPHPAPKTSGIYTTDRSGAKGYTPSDYTPKFGGTSSATPGVAGLAALILSVNPGLKWLEVRQILKESCQKIDSAGGQYDANGHSIYYGYGRPDALVAVQKAKALLVAASLPSIKIVSALVNPVGSNEAGKETVSLKNTDTQKVNLQHWSLKNEKGKTQELNNIQLTPGQVQTISLTILRLANTGGTIALFNETGQEVHRVQYSKSQGKLQGSEIQFA